MSYAEIKRISKGKKWLIALLVPCSLFLISMRKIALAQKIMELTGQASKTESNYTCALNYTYTTQFDEFTTLNGQKTNVADRNNQINKCEPLTAELTKTGLWDGRATYSPPACGPCGPCGGGGAPDCTTVAANATPFAQAVHAQAVATGTFSTAAEAAYMESVGVAACACTPPADFLTCDSQDTCVSAGTEYPLATTNDTGKGIFQEPITLAFKEANNNPGIICANNSCTAYASGGYTFEEKTTSTKFYGQCHVAANNATIKTASDIAQVTNDQAVSVINRPPVATVTFAKNSIAPGEEVNVTCNAVDPDTCSDKIARIKWTCTDSNGQSNNCYFWKEGTGVWSQGTANQDIAVSERTNPYQTTARFRAETAGAYSVACEAWDDDINNSLSSGSGTVGGNGAAVISVGVVAANAKFCSVLAKNDSTNENTCNGSVSQEFEPYTYGIEAEEYRWKCSDSDTPEETTNAVKKCTYTAPGTYASSLQILDKKTGEWTESNFCKSDTVVKVTQKDNCLNKGVGDKSSCQITGKSSCSVEARKLGSDNDYSNNLTINIGDTIEAKVNKKCLPAGTTQWSTSGTKLTGDNSSATVKFNTSGTGTIQAKVDNMDCGKVDVKTKETVKFGN